MERFNALGRGAQLMLVGSVLLLIDSFFRWQEVSVDLGPIGESSAGVSAWDNFLGILMGLLTIVLLARIVANLAAVAIPIPVSFAMTSAVLAFLIFAFALLKNLTDDYSTIWSYIGVGLAALIAVGAWMEIQAAGGVDSLKSEASALGASAGSGGSAAASTSAAADDTPAASAAPVAEPAAAAEEAQEAAGDAADAASDAASDATDAAADAAGGDPSPERES